MNINKADIVKWCAALDNGEYPQGKYKLQSKTGYCCLGVGCKIFTPEDKQRKDEFGYLVGDTAISQPDAPEWLKDISSDVNRKIGTSLVLLNDHSNFSFSEIATILELLYIHEIL